MLTSVGSSGDGEQPVSERQVTEPADEDEQHEGTDQDESNEFSRAIVHTTSKVSNNHLMLRCLGGADGANGAWRVADCKDEAAEGWHEWSEA